MTDHSSWFIGNHQVLTYFQSLIQANVWGFILLTGPQYVGKTTLIQSFLGDLVDPAYQFSDYRFITDLSDQRLELKQSNSKLTGNDHTIKVEMDESKQYITLQDHTLYHDRWAREMIERLSKTPINGTKVLHIENIERMSITASNALLKTLEEPYQNRRIIATSSKPHLLLETIVSRWYTLSFHEVEQGDPWWLGRPWLARRIKNMPSFQELDTIIQSIISSWRPGHLFSTTQSLFMKAHEWWVLELCLDALIVYYQDQSSYTQKLLYSKKLLSSNVAVANIIMNMMIE